MIGSERAAETLRFGGPNQLDYDILEQIYSHTDSFWTIAATSASSTAAR